MIALFPNSPFEFSGIRFLGWSNHPPGTPCSQAFFIGWLSTGWWTQSLLIGNGWKSPFPSIYKWLALGFQALTIFDRCEIRIPAGFPIFFRISDPTWRIIPWRTQVVFITMVIVFVPQLRLWDPFQMAYIFMAYKWWLQPNRSPLRSVLGADDPNGISRRKEITRRLRSVSERPLRCAMNLGFCRWDWG